MWGEMANLWDGFLCWIGWSTRCHHVPDDDLDDLVRRYNTIERRIAIERKWMPRDIYRLDR